jgi:hypothetical protein
MEEIAILENASFREAMSRLDFAEVWVSPFFDHLFRFNEGAGDVFNGMIADLADSSGYTELNKVPVVPLGHSAAASWPYYFAAWKPERTLAALSVSGQWPYFRNPVFAPDIWAKDQHIDFVPCLETMGEYEAAAGWAGEGLKQRRAHPFLPLSMLACPAEGHFAPSQEKIDYIAFYIKKAVQYRMPGHKKGNLSLQPVNPMATGWLVEKWRLNERSSFPAASVQQFKGDTAQAFWFFDEEMARYTERYEAKYYRMKSELLGYHQQGKIIQQQNTHQQVDVKFIPAEDGISFSLEGVFLDSVPAVHARLSQWTGLPPGSPVGHGALEKGIRIEKITGPFRNQGNNHFVLHPDKEIRSNNGTWELFFAAKHNGDHEYKPAVQQARMVVPAVNTAGKEQHIVFPAVPDQKEGVSQVRLSATSDAGVPVSYTVVSGPAEVDGNKLRISKIPPGSKFPVKVTVVAWQYGKTAEPRLQSAKPVQLSFYITK